MTVGAQMSFDRMIGWVDDWAEAQGRTDLVAQIGPTENLPKHLTVLPFMDPPAFRTQVAEADLIIAHAGMGSIINALELGKPIVVIPRRAALEETRNDHQVATARRLASEGLVVSAESPEELARCIAEIEAKETGAKIAGEANASLIARLREFSGIDSL
ncbi:MAG: glycosyltransferase [Myxococcota bacterium]